MTPAMAMRNAHPRLRSTVEEPFLEVNLFELNLGGSED